MNQNTHKVALITGSTHGIGKAIALKLAKAGSTKELSKEYLEKLTDIYKVKLMKKEFFIFLNNE